MRFHPIELAIESLGRGLRRQIEHEREIRLEPAGGKLANPPEFGDVETAGVPLVNDIR